MGNVLLAIDPGTTESGFVMVDMSDYRILNKGKLLNETMLRYVDEEYFDECVIEMMDCHGQMVGKEVFETAILIGRISEKCERKGFFCRRINRGVVKMNMTHVTRSDDAWVNRALRERFGEKGTKKNPGWFFGVSADVWQAYALAVTYIDQVRGCDYK